MFDQPTPLRLLGDALIAGAARREMLETRMAELLAWWGAPTPNPEAEALINQILTENQPMLALKCWFVALKLRRETETAASEETAVVDEDLSAT